MRGHTYAGMCVGIVMVSQTFRTHTLHDHLLDSVQREGMTPNVYHLTHKWNVCVDLLDQIL